MRISSWSSPAAVGVTLYTDTRVASSAFSACIARCWRCLPCGRPEGCAFSTTSGPTSVFQLKLPGGSTSGTRSPLDSLRVRHGTKPYVNMARTAALQKGT